MKPRKLIHLKYCWQTYFKSNGTLSDNSGGKNRDASEGGIWFIFHGIWFLSCVIACSTFYPLSNQINLFTVIMRYNNKYYHVCQQYFKCMSFLGFIRYNKTFIACGFRKYENVFTHEYHIPPGRCPQGIWYSCVNKFIFIFSEPACYKCFIIPNETKKTHTFKILLANIF
jgi:hypothetical protein